ncbi:Vacuolar protein sorting-associated protein 54, chloroplastic [Linum perenne]
MDSQPSFAGRSLVDSTATTSSSSAVPSSLSVSRTNSSLAKSVSDASSQSLSSILNNPHVGKSGVYGSDATWVGWWSSSAAVAPPEFAPLISTKAASEVSRSDFQSYLSSISDFYYRFEDIRIHTTKEETLKLESIGGQGEALVACLREVPALYFKEDFALEDGGTFRAACPFSNVSENLVLQEKLSHYLDVVELHLVKEISLRSNSFFEAQGELQDLNVRIVEGCSRIRELKETIKLLDKDLVESAREIQDLNGTRGNLLALQQKLRLILYVNQALSALKLLVASGDCAGALDVTEDLQHLLDGDELTGLHCFRHLRDHVTTSVDSVNSILSTEFLRASIHDTGETDIIILSKAKSRATSLTNGKVEEVKLDDEYTSNFRERLLPIVVCLLRTAKLPSILRIYRDTLTADMKSSIKNAVAELLPILVARPLESDFTPGEQTVDADVVSDSGGGLSLASKLRSLSAESFVQLLGAIFRIVQVHLMRAAEVKRAIEWIMSNIDGHYAADSVAAAIAAGSAAAEAAQGSDAHVGSLGPLLTQRSSSFKAQSSQGKTNDAGTASSMSKNFRADVLRENAESVFAACDAAHGRWAKLLGVRALLHPKLRLQEFLSIYNITQEFISSTEKAGGRLGYSIRGTLQSQAKAFVELQHEMRMTKMKAVLDQETWVEVDVPDEFQGIITSLFSSETLMSAELVAAQCDGVASNDGSVVHDSGTHAQQQLPRKDSVDKLNNAQLQSHPLSESTGSNKTDIVTSSAQGNNKTTKDRGKSASQKLFYGGIGYHMVNCGLILVKMLSEYIDMNNYLPSLSSEVVHRVVEILKFFNTRTCQLVLGAGAMQVSGLKSITSKHLALASQVISFTYSIIPGGEMQDMGHKNPTRELQVYHRRKTAPKIRQVLFSKVPETRKALLLSEIDRVAQDFKVHRDEIHTKLVQIMRERLFVHLRGLPQIVDSWNRPEEADPQPSQFARSLSKEVGYLQRVLSRTLHESDVKAIFRQVVVIFHSQISEAYSRLDISTPQAKDRLHRDVKHILGCIRSLPSDNLNQSGTPNWGQLDEFLVQKFGAEAAK